MKPLFTCHIVLLGCCICLSSACNSSREAKEQALTTVAQPTVATPQAPTYEEFRKMTAEERWRTASPARRNYLRQNPNLYPYMTAIILADPEMEEEPPPSPPNPNQAPAFSQQPNILEYTPEQWWNSFSTERKKHIREHPELFPEFKDFLNRP